MVSVHKIEWAQTDGKLVHSRARKNVRRKSRRGSTPLVIGTMIVLNVLVAAYLFKMEFKRPGQTEIPAPAEVNLPRLQPRSEFNPAPNQDPRPELKATPPESKPVPQPTNRAAKPAGMTAMPSRITLGAVMPEPSLQARPSTAQANPIQALDTSSNTNIASPAGIATARTPVGGVWSKPEPFPKKSGPASLHNGTQSSLNRGSANMVAPVGLPEMVRGTLPPKTAVAPVSPKLEILVQPGEHETPSCGGIVGMPCPKLRVRPAPSSTGESN